jgi:hypothetical protein
MVQEVRNKVQTGIAELWMYYNLIICFLLDHLAKKSVFIVISDI